MSKKDIAGKYTLTVAAGIVATVLALPVYAQTTPPPSPAPAAPAAAAPAAPAAAPQAQSKTPAEDKAAEARRFGDDKQKLITKIDDLMGKMKDRRSCIQASTDRDSMRACFAQAVTPPGDGKGDPNASGSAPATPPAVKK